MLPKSHAGKGSTILEQYRDELFQSSADELFATATGIPRLGERQRIRLFVRATPSRCSVSCLILRSALNVPSSESGCRRC